MKQQDLFPPRPAAALLLPGCQEAARLEPAVRERLAELGLTLTATVLSAGGRRLDLVWTVAHGHARLLTYEPATGNYRQPAGARGHIDEPGKLPGLCAWLLDFGSRETQPQPAVRTKRPRKRRRR